MNIIKALVKLPPFAQFRKKNHPNSVHHKNQARSKRCISCGEKLLQPGSTSPHDSTVRPGKGVTFSGGKISCDSCNVDHGHYCVHGVPLDDYCEFCPHNSRTHNEYERKS